MKYGNFILFILLSLLPRLAGAQAIDNTLSYKNINADKYFRLNYENDYFAANDKYYTQGIHLEWVGPKMRYFPLNALLGRIPLRPFDGYYRTGLAVEHEGYTPINIASADIQKGDRPFAACVFLKSFETTVDTIYHRRFSAALSAGIIGPAAGGNEMQTAIHDVLPRNTVPGGWHNQVANDVILNYQVDFEKQLIRYGHLLSLDAHGMARIGTLSDKAGIGTTLMFGHFSDPFHRGHRSHNNFQLYAYEHPGANVILYDATMQGGVFENKSAYTISDRDITRYTFENRFGFVLTWRKLYLEYFQSFLSAEFKTGDYHTWGGIQIAFAL